MVAPPRSAYLHIPFCHKRCFYCDFSIIPLGDSAQAPGAKYYKKFAGTFGDIGGFSLNCHKHINTGEGGILVTNNDKYAKRLRLIRNHAEAVVDKTVNNNTPNMLGHNFRLGEIESAIGLEQIKKLKSKVKKRQQKDTRAVRRKANQKQRKRTRGN